MTDPAVTAEQAAAEALAARPEGVLASAFRGDMDPIAATAVAAARPVIEAEVREALLPETARAVVAERHRIAADLRRQRDLFVRADHAWIALDLAAVRIAKGDTA